MVEHRAAATPQRAPARAPRPPRASATDAQGPDDALAQPSILGSEGVVAAVSLSLRDRVTLVTGRLRSSGQFGPAG